MKTLTAEEFLRNSSVTSSDRYDFLSKQELMIAFAKMHVQEALKQAFDSIPCLGSSTDIASYEEVEEAILNAYPLENII